MATEKLFLRGNNRDSFAYEDENQPLARPDSNIDDYIIGKQVPHFCRRSANTAYKKETV